MEYTGGSAAFRVLAPLLAIGIWGTAGCATTPASATDPPSLVSQAQRPPQPLIELTVAPPSSKEARGLERLLLPARGSQVPNFRAQTIAGDVLDSVTLAGNQPFVVMFFTSWCPVCERKMPIVRDALEAAGGTVVAIGVAMDDEDTFGDVSTYVDRHGIPFRVVQGATAPDIVRALDPRGSFPVVYVVGQGGAIADVQIGLQPDHASRLEQALRVVLARPNDGG